MRSLSGSRGVKLIYLTRQYVSSLVILVNILCWEVLRPQQVLNIVFLRYCSLFQLKAKIKVEFGKAGETIYRIAEQERVDYIVMGGRGLSTLRRTLLGGVSDYVIKHTQIPVVFVPGQH